MDENRARLVEAIGRLLSIAQLDTLVRRGLGRSLEYFSTARDLPTIVDQLLVELERRPQDLLPFLLRLGEWMPRPELRAAIDAYLGLSDAGGDYYKALMVLDEPFIDRKLSRDKVQQLFENPNRRALVTRGVRASGKTHSRWYVQYVTKRRAIQMVYVDVLEDNTVALIITKLVNQLRLPANDVRDRLAQAPTASKGFVSALSGYAQDAAGQEWCLVFDGLDRDEVSKEVRELVDLLFQEVANLQLPTVWLILLGYRDAVPRSFRVRVIEDSISQITAPDVEGFLQDLAELSGKMLPTTRKDEMRDFIFNGLTPPLDHEGMTLLIDRLREKLVDLEAL